jgi:hypothetical protein
MVRSCRQTKIWVRGTGEGRRGGRPRAVATFSGARRVPRIFRAVCKTSVHIARLRVVLRASSFLFSDLVVVQDRPGQDDRRVPRRPASTRQRLERRFDDLWVNSATPTATGFRVPWAWPTTLRVSPSRLSRLEAGHERACVSELAPDQPARLRRCPPALWVAPYLV